MKYYLVDNALTSDNLDDCYAEPVAGKRRTTQDLIEQIVYRSVGLTASQVASVLKEAQAATERFLAEGDTLETEMYVMKPRIRGVFANSDEALDRTKHRPYIKITANRRLKKLAATLPLERVDPVRQVPQPRLCLDLETDATNTLTLDGNARIKGNHLKFDKSDPQQGLFLIDSKGKATRVMKFIDIAPKQLTFRVPKTLVKDTYQVEVRSTLETKELRVGKLARPVVVK